VFTAILLNKTVKIISIIKIVILRVKIDIAQ